MSNYKPIVITEEIERRFKPTRLAVKELNGVKYFCKTVRKNIEKYSGSGVRWSNHIKKYGKENIKTLWISDWFKCPRHLQDFALMFSEYNQIVEDQNWANIISENGLTGMIGSKKGHMAGIPKPKSESHRKSISETLSGINMEDRHGKEKADSIKDSMSKSHTGKKQSEAAIKKSVAYHTGKKRSSTTIERLTESRKHYKNYICEHCGKEFVPAMYHRWHGKYCLENPNRESRPKTKTPKSIVTKNSVELNGVRYDSLADAYNTLKLPRNLLRRMLNADQTSNPKYGINTLRLVGDDTYEESSPSLKEPHPKK